MAAHRDSSLAKSSSVMLPKALEAYNTLLMKYTYPTKMISSGIVGGLGDILIQLFGCLQSGRPLTLDFRRLVVFTTVTTFYIAPVIHVWFDWLEKFRVPKIFGESKFSKSLYMIILDQTIGAAVISAGFFYAFELSNRLFPPYAGSSWLQALRAGTKMNERNLWHTLVMNWYCWPLINLVNFYFVPIQFRLLFSNVAAVFWNMFLSKVANA